MKLLQGDEIKLITDGIFAYKQTNNGSEGHQFKAGESGEVIDDECNGDVHISFKDYLTHLRVSQVKFIGVSRGQCSVCGDFTLDYCNICRDKLDKNVHVCIKPTCKNIHEVEYQCNS